MIYRQKTTFSSVLKAVFKSAYNRTRVIKITSAQACLLAIFCSNGICRNKKRIIQTLIKPHDFSMTNQNQLSVQNCFLSSTKWLGNTNSIWTWTHTHKDRKQTFQHIVDVIFQYIIWEIKPVWSTIPSHFYLPLTVQNIREKRNWITPTFHECFLRLVSLPLTNPLR